MRVHGLQLLACCFPTDWDGVHEAEGCYVWSHTVLETSRRMGFALGQRCPRMLNKLVGWAACFDMDDVSTVCFAMWIVDSEPSTKSGQRNQEYAGVELNFILMPPHFGIAEIWHDFMIFVCETQLYNFWWTPKTTQTKFETLETRTCWLAMMPPYSKQVFMAAKALWYSRFREWKAVMGSVPNFGTIHFQTSFQISVSVLGFAVQRRRYHHVILFHWPKAVPGEVSPM